MDKPKKLNRWVKNLSNLETGYIDKNNIKNKLSKEAEEEKNAYYSKYKENLKSTKQDNSETSDDDMSSSISTASIGQILTKALSSIEITDNLNNSNKNNFNQKKFDKRKLKTNKELETNKFHGRFAISSLKGKTILNTIISNKSKDKTGKINQIKIKSRSIKRRDKYGKNVVEKKEAYNNEGTGEKKYMYKKKNENKLFKKVNKINTHTGDQEQYVEYENLKVNQSRNKNKDEENFDIYYWSFREKDKKKEKDNIKNFKNSSNSKLKVGERKYHKKKVY